MSNTLPYTNESTNLLYQMLFCDNFEVYRNNEGENKSPFKTLFEENPQIEELEELIKNPTTQSRTKVLAYKKLSERGHLSSAKDLLGVIIEVGLDNGLDTLAAYKDGAARYINQSEKIIIWDSPNADTLAIIEKLFSQGKEVIEKIGPWDKSRLIELPTGQVRLTFLVADKIYFGQGPMNALFNDPIGGPVLQTATALMQYLASNAH